MRTEYRDSRPEDGSGPPHEVVQEIERLYEAGQFVAAGQRVEAYAPIRQWRDSRSRLIGGRLAHHLGAPRLSRRLLVAAWKAAPDMLEARYFGLKTFLERRGPVLTWIEMLRRQPPADADARLRAEWLAFEGQVLASMRDLGRAMERIEAAERLAPDHPWIAIERSLIEIAADRFAESLESARRALELRPWYAAGVLATAHCLVLVNRRAEAIQLLLDADRRLQSAAVVAHLATLQIELRQPQDTLGSLDRYRQLALWMEPELEQWEASVRAEALYELGDIEGARKALSQVDTELHRRFADRLGQRAVTLDRRRLPVGFIPQYHVTCVPASIATVARYWQREVDQNEIAEAITYEGTAPAQERLWLESNGWLTREFTVDWPSSRALIDRGVPFLLTTVGVTEAHEQVVIGYDTVQQSLLIRDPSSPVEVVADVHSLLESQQASGPRGLAVVPEGHAELLEDLELKDSLLYDRLYAVQMALNRHDRDAATVERDGLARMEPEHRLTFEASRQLAVYDRNVTSLVQGLDRLLEMFPGNCGLVLQKAAALQEMAPWADRISWLERVVEADGFDPVIATTLALELAQDARQDQRVERLLRRAVVLRPTDPVVAEALAGQWWVNRDRAEALELYRCAACLGEFREEMAGRYFVASTLEHRQAEALAWLEDRAVRFATRSSQPVQTVFWALSAAGRMERALERLEQALEARPEDGELLLFAADVLARIGHFNRSGELLERARSRARSSDWARTAAAVASYRGEPVRSLELWHEVLEAEPMAMDAIAAMCRLTTDLEGLHAAVERAERIAEELPYFCPVHSMLAEMLRDLNPGEAERVVQHVLNVNPNDTWAHRELALHLARGGDSDAALAQLDEADRLEPDGPANLLRRGQVLMYVGDWEKGIDAFRKAVELAPDFGEGIQLLVGACADHASRVAECRRVSEALQHQVTLGEALTDFAAAASGVLEPHELLERIDVLWTAHPDVWHGWSIRTRQLLAADRIEDATAAATAATERFPWHAMIWVDRAAVAHAAGDTAAEREALHTALTIEPTLAEAARHLARIERAEGNRWKAREFLEQATARCPMDVECLLELALLHAEDEETDSARSLLERAVRMDPSRMDVWNQLGELEQRPGETLELARSMARERRGSPSQWLVVAELATDFEESLAAVERVLADEPRSEDAWDLRAELLVGQGRLEEAWASCEPEPFNGQVPARLRARQAWVQAQGGDLHEAVVLMRTVLTEEPSYPWAWLQMAEWTSALNDSEGYLDASEALVRVAPEHPMSWAYLGHARDMAEDTAGAETAYEHALQIAPDFGPVAESLVELRVHVGRLEAAEAVLESGLGDLPSATVAALRARMSVARGDQEGVIQHLCDMLEAPEPLDDRHADAALYAADQLDLRNELVSLLDRRLRTSPTPAVAAWWARLLCQRRKWRQVLRRIGTLLEVESAARAALLELLSNAAGRCKRRVVQLAHRRFSALCRGDDLLWGQMGFALNAVGDRKATVDWMQDWREREGAEGWMLANLASSLRVLGVLEYAALVADRSVELPPFEGVNARLAWSALDHALLDDVATAQDRLRRVDALELDPADEFAFDLAWAVCVMAPGEAAGHEDPLACARERLARARRRTPGWEHSPDLSRAYRAAGRAIRRRMSGVRGWLWSVWRL